jgi:hypothetical protein
MKTLILTITLTAKIGETVICIDVNTNTSSPLTLNNSYIVMDVIKNYSPIHGREIDRYYSIYNNDGDYGNYFIERFKTKAEIRNELIENIIK